MKRINRVPVLNKRGDDGEWFVMQLVDYQEAKTILEQHIKNPRQRYLEMEFIVENFKHNFLQQVDKQVYRQVLLEVEVTLIGEVADFQDVSYELPVLDVPYEFLEVSVEMSADEPVVIELSAMENERKCYHVIYDEKSRLDAKFPYYRNATEYTLEGLSNTYLNTEMEGGLVCPVHGRTCGCRLKMKYSSQETAMTSIISCSRYYESHAQLQVFRCARMPWMCVEQGETSKGFKYLDQQMVDWYAKWARENHISEVLPLKVIHNRRRWQGHVIRIDVKGPLGVRVTCKVKFKYFLMINN